MDAVVAGLDDERAAVDGHETTGRILVIARLHAVAASRDGKGAVGHLHAVFAAQSYMPDAT